MKNFLDEYWTWAKCLSLLQVKVDLSMLVGPKQAGLEHDSSSTRGMKVGLGVLLGSKHNGLKPAS